MKTIIIAIMLASCGAFAQKGLPLVDDERKCTNISEDLRHEAHKYMDLYHSPNRPAPSEDLKKALIELDGWFFIGWDGDYHVVNSLRETCEILTVLPSCN